jgi:predicted DNA-binding protein (MmcQ/YjbR family)
MRAGDIEKHCLSLTAATLSLQWGDHRVFKVGGKIFAVIGFGESGRDPSLSFKTADDSFEILTTLKNVIPAPYMARNKWVQVQKLDALPAKDLRAYLTRAHALVAAKLPKKTRQKLGLFS